MLGSQALGPGPPWLRTRVLCGPGRVGAWVLGGALLRTGFLSPTFPRTPLAQDPGPERGQSNWVLGSWVLSRVLLRTRVLSGPGRPCSGTFVPARTWVLSGGGFLVAGLRTWVLSGPGRPCSRTGSFWVRTGVLSAPPSRTWVLEACTSLAQDPGAGPEGPGPGRLGFPSGS